MKRVSNFCLSVLIVTMMFVSAPVALGDEIENVDRKPLKRLILSNQCRVDTAFGVSPYLAPLIPGAIDATVGSIVGAIKKAGEDSTKTIEVSHSDFFYVLERRKTEEFKPKHGCLTVVIGSAKKEQKRSKPTTADADITSAINQIANYFQPADYEDGFTIDVLYEIRIENAQDNRSFRLVANALYVDKYLHKSRSSRSRNYLVTVDLKKPNTEAGKAYASIALPLVTEISDDSFVGAETLKNMAIHSRWIPYPSLSDASKAQLAKVAELKASEASQKKAGEVQATCGTPPADDTPRTYSDECLKKLYPAFASATDPTLDKLRTFRLQLDQRNLALEQARFNALKAPGKRAAEAAETEQSIQKLIAEETGAAVLKCTEVDRRRLQNCLGAPQPGNEPTCAKASVPACAEAGGAEFMMWSASITETRPGSKFMKKLGGILESGQEGLVAELKTELDPARIAELEKEAETARQARVTLQDKLRQAQQQVELKTLEFNAAATDLDRRKLEYEILNKKHEANEIARQLGLPAPYSDI